MKETSGHSVSVPSAVIVVGAIIILALGALNLAQWLTVRSPQSSTADVPRRQPSSDASNAPDVKTMVVKYAPLEKRIELNAQVSLTEMGHDDITAPLNGTVLEPEIRVGQWIEAGTPIAVVNSAFGQTSLQLLGKIEQDQNAVINGQNQWQSAIALAGQAQAALAAADTARSQAKDNFAQARAEMANATNDYRRKKELFVAGVYSQADVDDARERWLKARAVEKDTRDLLAISQRGVDIARSNLLPARENVRLTRDALDLLRAQLDRDRAIYSQPAVSGAQLPQNLTPVDVEKASRFSRSASANSAMFYVRAPISGVVTVVNMVAGQSVQSGAVLASVVDTREVYVDGSAYEADLSRLKTGDRVKVHTSAYPGDVFPGTVHYISQQVDPNTRTIAVRSRISNPKHLLKGGMFVTVDVIAERPRQALVVPTTAVLVDGEEHYVMVEVAAGRYEKRKVREGVRTDSVVELLAGVHAGERVVVAGNLLEVPD